MNNTFQDRLSCMPQSIADKSPRNEMTLSEAIRRPLMIPCTIDHLAKWLPRVPQRLGQSHVVVYPGLVADADALGVSRFHLYKVLRGQRESRRLLAAYHALKGVR